MITAIIIAIIVANLPGIIPVNTLYAKYEQTPIMKVAIAGFITNFDKFILIFKCLTSDVIAITNATAWHATDAQAAPFTPMLGIGTSIRFNINLVITPAS